MSASMTPRETSRTIPAAWKTVAGASRRLFRPGCSGDTDPAAEAGVLLFALLLLGDLALIVAHYVVGSLDSTAVKPFRINRDFSYGEMFGHLKEVWAIATLAAVALRERRPRMLGWAVLFAIVLADDLGRLHEQAAFWLADSGLTAAVGPVSAVSLGELLFFAALAPLLLAAAFLAATTRHPIDRRLAVDLGVLVVLLGGCAVGVDVVHAAAGGEPFGLWTLLEDGGEMVLLSAIAARCVVRFLTFGPSVPGRDAADPNDLSSAASPPTGPLPSGETTR